LRKELDSPGWASSPDLDTEPGRRASEDQLDAALAAWCAQHDASAIVDLLSTAGVPTEVVIAPREVSHNPQIRHRHLFETEVHPLTGTNEVPGLPFRFSEIDHWVRMPAPMIGQHNDEILGELGLEPEQLAELAATNVVGTRPLGVG
jgi:crotonobetainyl-CoA:carnitine CoA-transferase CaiB-like acyl-CoA transferase